MLAIGSARAAAPRCAALSARIRTIAPDLVATIALVVGAAAVRYPYLWVAPRFRDETFNALRSLAIYRGQLAPLTDVELYMGSFFNYAVAAAFFILGPTIYVPRLVVTAFGVATVAATYFLGREVGGRLVGLIAAALLLTNGVHIAAMGHMGFSANIAPFFTTVGFWLLHRAIVRDAGVSLALAGFFMGMGLHTHPTTIAFLPGALGWFLWKGWRWLRTPWPYAALLLFIVAYSPMIIYNVQTGGESLRHAMYTATERPDYARGRSTTLTPESYLDRQADLWLMSFQTVGGALDGRAGPSAYLTDPVLVATAVLAVVGMIWAARRGYSLPIWALLSCALILPLFNATHYDVVGDGHYVAKALPLVYAAMGLLFVDAARIARDRLGPDRSRAVTVGLAVLVVLLVLAPLQPLSRYYARASRAEPTNASLIRAMDELKARRQGNETVLLDDSLNDRAAEFRSPWDEYSTFRVFRLILEFDAIPYEVADVDEAVLADRAARGQPMILILSPGRDSREAAEIGRLAERYRLRSLDGGSPRAPRPGDRYAMYRLDPMRSATGS